MSKRETLSREDEIILGLLDAVAKNGQQSQRNLAQELGIALGLVNAYLRLCLSKGLLKMSSIPARRYAYYVTPRGFSEKARLSVSFLSDRMSFFREARDDCLASISAAERFGHRRVVLVGSTELAEIALICGLQTQVSIVAIVDRHSKATSFAGLPVVRDFAAVPGGFDAAIVTDTKSPVKSFRWACDAVGDAKVFAPKLLRLPVSHQILAEVRS